MSIRIANIILPSDVEAFKNYVKGDSGDMDFNKVVCMPKSLMLPKTCLWKIEGEENTVSEFQKDKLEPLLERILMTTNSADEFVSSAKNLVDKLGMSEAVLENYPFARRDELYIDSLYGGYYNLKKYGYVDWYEWSLNYWGTKWNTHISEWNDGVLQFDTKWKVPICIYDELSKHFDFVAFYADEDYGTNMGYIKAENGVMSLDTLDGVPHMIRVALANIICGDNGEFEYEQLIGKEGVDYPTTHDINQAFELYHSLLSVC